ncbi:hypothetical protein V2K05_22965 [Pseudomonas alliivorans]|uniref:Uncharacterized protein n=1 Tax=Pseudomonas cannabina pv. alisalensis TaxID=757414 RepID=A0ABS1X7S7_PSEC1|nr:hypothetical protein [Pseudomonas cannabina]MEE4964485.1 hypothetical protein [Pseudomonas alliivorans]MBM0137545.1 hypothetical protein [Pseudomonas cannabina pv. alisalensis]MEE4974568.1 hypothetical protein [Pseudomonas alliivorans]MEE4979717.1 hypothetical protein [Pseudomonas alliivorans]MEE4984830.1 hypothetical protein [Pseudomonas alliivorans]
MTAPFNFYAPYQMPDGTWIFGAAAANKRVADAGGHNALAINLVQIGFQQAVALHKANR